MSKVLIRYDDCYSGHEECYSGHYENLLIVDKEDVGVAIEHIKRRRPYIKTSDIDVCEVDNWSPKSEDNG